MVQETRFWASQPLKAGHLTGFSIEPEERNHMPHDNEKSRAQPIPPKLKGFPFAPVRFEDGLPVFQGVEARKELVRRFGLPNAAPRSGEPLFGNVRIVFVDDEHDGERIAYHEP